MYNEQDLRIWDGIFADVPDEWTQAPPSKAMETCAAWLREVGARDILDVGCGVDRWSGWLAQHGFRMWGADFAPRGIAYARDWATCEGLDIPFECAPITERAFPDRHFDAVVASLVFDLVSPDELGVALDVCREALGSTGHLFAVFNPRDMPAESKDNPTASATVIQYSDTEIEEIFGSAGFHLLRWTVLDQGTRGYLWRAAGQVCRDAGEEWDELR